MTAEEENRSDLASDIPERQSRPIKKLYRETQLQTALRMEGVQQEVIFTSISETSNTGMDLGDTSGGKRKDGRGRNHKKKSKKK